MKTTFTFIFACTSTLLMAQSAGPFNGSNFYNVSCGGQQNWSQEANSISSDDSYAVIGNLPGNAGAFSEYLVATGFNFDLPDGVTVYGVKVDVERSDPNQITIEHSVKLVIGGLIVGNDKSTGAPYPATDAYATYGGPSDLWGNTISYKDIDNSNFGIAVAVKRKTDSGITDARIDNIQITVYYSFLTLPVQLQSFTATRHDNAVKIGWITAAESGIDKYLIERSSDGNNFQPLAQVVAKNLDGSSYQHADNRPFPGISYYRLRIVEKNGVVKYSSVASVFMSTKNDLKISPSPWSVTQDLFISNNGNEKLLVKFYNSNGELVAETRTNGRKLETDRLGKLNGIVYYKVFDSANRKLSEGSILVH